MINLFNNIKPEDKDKILLFLEANTLFYKKNTTILNSVRKENIIGIVQEGNIQITKTDYNGNTSIIEDLYESDIFGFDFSSISNIEQNIITKEDSKITIIYFDDIINKELNYSYYNQFLKNLLIIMSSKINNANNRIEILSNKTIRNKLLAYFKIISKKNKSKIIYLPYSYTDLADYLGVDRSAMYRELKHLKEEGLIETKNKRITLKTYDE